MSKQQHNTQSMAYNNFRMFVLKFKDQPLVGVIEHCNNNNISIVNYSN